MIYVILTIIYILATHFVADFIMQSDEMAKGKSTSIYWLTKHVFAYINTFLISAIIFYILYYSFGGESNVTFALLMVGYIMINSILHWVTDYFTSKQVKKYFDVQDFHNGFIIIGLDQLIHATCLILTFWWIYL